MCSIYSVKHFPLADPLDAIRLALSANRIYQDQWTSSTGYLPRKCFDITEKLIRAALNTKQSNKAERSLSCVITILLCFRPFIF